MGFMGWVTSTIDADYTYYSLEHSSQQGAAETVPSLQIRMLTN